MSYRTRSARRVAKKSQRNLVVTLIIIIILLYTTINWILPTLINGVGFINNFLKPSEKQESISDNASLAPPILNIPYEATNSSLIDINGFTISNSEVKLYLDDTFKASTKSDDSGKFTFRDVELFLGTNNIYGKTVDDKNKESLPSKVIILIYDNEKPSLEVLEPEDGKQIQGERKLKVAGKTEDKVQIFVNETRVIVNNGSFSTTINLSDGDNNIIIKAIDQASNVNELSRRVNFQP